MTEYTGEDQNQRSEASNSHRRDESSRSSGDRSYQWLETIIAEYERRAYRRSAGSEASDPREYKEVAPQAPHSQSNDGPNANRDSMQYPEVALEGDRSPQGDVATEVNAVEAVLDNPQQTNVEIILSIGWKIVHPPRDFAGLVMSKHDEFLFLERFPQTGGASAMYIIDTNQHPDFAADYLPGELLTGAILDTLNSTQSKCYVNLTGVRNFLEIPGIHELQGDLGGYELPPPEPSELTNTSVTREASQEIIGPNNDKVSIAVWNELSTDDKTRLIENITAENKNVKRIAFYKLTDTHKDYRFSSRETSITNAKDEVFIQGSRRDSDPPDSELAKVFRMTIAKAAEIKKQRDTEDAPSQTPQGSTLPPPEESNSRRSLGGKNR